MLHCNDIWISGQQVVAAAAEQQLVINACANSDQIRSTFPHLMEQLELCQKSLSAYLECKRSEFPRWDLFVHSSNSSICVKCAMTGWFPYWVNRFYFVSDSTLLEILSLGSDPVAVMPHFQSGLFDSLAGMQMDAECKHKIMNLTSVQGEIVPLSHALEAKGVLSAVDGLICAWLPV